MTETIEDKIVRRGPSPLPVHIGVAVAEYSRIQYEGKASPQDMEQMLAGIRKYQQHHFRRSIEPLPVIWQEGEVKVFHSAADNAAASLFIIPSLINRSYILDLLPKKSFVRWLAAQGIDTYLLDWGESVSDPAQQTMDSLITGPLCAAIKHVSDRAGEQIHALGYCMGGTLLAAAAQRKSENLRSIICLASPWDFSAGDEKLSAQVKLGTASALQMVQHNTYLPMDWIQSVFATVNADRTMHKFLGFAALDDDSEQAQLFVAVEDWLNDGVDLPGDLAKSCLLDWYGENKPGSGCWQVDGKSVDLSGLDVPALVVASLTDRLVPRESSLAMAGILPQAKTLEPRSGHIGMITGGKAKEQVWQPIADWIQEKA